MTSALLPARRGTGTAVGDSLAVATACSDSMATETVGDRVRRYRRLHRMTQPQLAAAARTDKGYIGRLEVGKISEPSLEVLKRLSGALGVPIRTLAPPEYYEESVSADLIIGGRPFDGLTDSQLRLIEEMAEEFGAKASWRD